MSTMTRAGTETSVTFSLAELARLEQDRVREEDERRARAREEEARARREEEGRRREQEIAELRAQDEARAKRQREAAEEQARIEARERAALEVARIEAAGKARLDAENAQRAHELALLKVRTEGGRKRLIAALSAALALSFAGAAVAAITVEKRMDRMTVEAVELRDRLQALSKERERAKATELAALDKRFEVLKARAREKEANEARKSAEAARDRVDPKALDHDRLRAFADALDAYAARIDAGERIAQLDRRRDDLAAWAADRRRGEALATARSAGAKAKLLGTDEAARAYEAALESARGELAQASAGAGRAAGSTSTTQKGSDRACLAGDPNCGLDGRPVF